MFVFAGSCTFDEGFTPCDYQQDPYDDFDWTHTNTQEAPYVSPELPQGESARPLAPLRRPPVIERISPTSAVSTFHCFVGHVRPGGHFFGIV